MDWELVYDWLEQHSGVSYDVNEYINEIKGSVAFTDTYFWMTKISLIFDDVNDAKEVVDDNYRELTEDLPSRGEFKRALEQDVVEKVLYQVNAIKRQLGITPVKLKNSSEIMQHVIVMRDLIDMLKSFDMESIVQDKLFEKHEEENDDSFAELLDLHKNDMTNMWETVQTIVNDIELNDDDDDWGELDEELVDDEVDNDNEE